MDRLTFFNSISGIKYPEMLVEFYDQFLALKQLLSDKPCAISVLDSSDRTISFMVECRDSDLVNYLVTIPMYVVYGRTISIYSEILSSKQIKLIMQ